MLRGKTDIQAYDVMMDKIRSGIPEHSIFLLVGPIGCGKTTLGNALEKQGAIFHDGFEWNKRKFPMLKEECSKKVVVLAMNYVPQIDDESMLSRITIIFMKYVTNMIYGVTQ